jgi:hypothetical protein
VGRKRSISEDAEGTTVYLTPDDQIIVRAILAKRKKKSLARASLNEIWLDALWLLAEQEGFTRKKLEAFLSDD